MAYGQNPGPPAASATDEDNYSDGPSQAAPQNDDAQEESAEGATALLPKSILMGKDFKVGEEVMLKITAIHGNEIQVAYAPEKGGDEETGEGESPSAPTQVPKDAEMASMME